MEELKNTNIYVKCTKCGRFLDFSHSDPVRTEGLHETTRAYFHCNKDDLIFFKDLKWVKEYAL